LKKRGYEDNFRRKGETMNTQSFVSVSRNRGFLPFVGKIGKILLLGLFFVILIPCFGFAQSSASSLREGVYQAAGSPDETYINANYEYRRTKNGYYTAEIYAGSTKNKTLMIVAAGKVNENELRMTVRRSDLTAFAQALDLDPSSVRIEDGTLIIWTISNNETFIDPVGNRWVWMRAKK
jgi:hypothetical protein